MNAPLHGVQKITNAEAQEIRVRFAAWSGPSGAFVAAEAQRYRVTRETIRRILRGETHLAPLAGAGALPPAFPWAGTPTPPLPLDAEESARRLLEGLGAPSGEAAVDAFREEIAPPPSEDHSKLG